MRSEVSSLKLLDTKDTMREQVMVAVHDTLREVTTISVQMNETGDTVFKSMVTERDRLRWLSDVREKKEEARVVIDSVHIERNDSVRTQNARLTSRGENWSSSLVSVLKWVVAVMVVLSMLIIIVRLKV